MSGDDSSPRDAATVRVPPPLVYLAVILVGVALHELVRPLPFGLERSLRMALAVAVALPGVALVAGALRLFRAIEQDPKPWTTTPEIVRTGVYRVTRNPMYLGIALLQAALGIGLGNSWVLFLAPVSCALVQITAIRPEEAYLERKFGEVYLDYKRSVRRWF